MEKKPSLSERYFEKPKRLKTASGIAVKETYTPEDVDGIEYTTEIGNPGGFPYTRGIFPTMYRARIWSIREICGFSSARATNRRLRYLIGEGETALNVIPDAPTACCIDSDHPRARPEVGLMGTPWCSLKDMEIMMEGIPIEQVSMTLSSLLTPPFVMYLAAAEKQGVPFDGMRGTILNDSMCFPLAGWHIPSMPQEIAVKLTVDTILYCAQHVPLFYPVSVGSVALRESGATAAQEIGFDFCIARHYMKEAVRRGVDIDFIAPKITFTHRVGVDIFEEAAKFRAARKVWARMLREEMGAKNPRSWTYKVHVVTKGSDLIAQQAENNIIRIAYQALAGVLGGVQSMHTTSYDEPIGIPTEESVRIALRTQQILAYETGAINVADPLGGSYYVESLTSQLEKEITEVIDEYKDKIAQAIESGLIMKILDRQAYQKQGEIEKGELTVVGLNAFTISEEEQRTVELHGASEEDVKEHLENLAEVRRSRNNGRVKECLESLFRQAQKEEDNLIPSMLEAMREYTTLGEVLGAIRLAYGYSYDPFEEIESPF